MTVCIAASCGKDYVVVATDRMLTLTVPSIEWEADSSKAIEVSPNCVASTAGSAIGFVPVLENAYSGLAQEKTRSIPRMAEIIRVSYEHIRNKKLDEEVFASFGLSLQGFYQANHSMMPQLVGVVLQRMQTYNYGLWILLAGVDDSGPHIYRIENPASASCFDSIGYHAIGSGDIHAISTFITNEYRVKDTSLNRVIALVYEGKKRSEKAQGVGPQTDLMVVSRDRTTHLPAEALTELDTMYTRRLEEEKRVLADVEKQISELKLVDKYIPKSGA